MQTKIPKNSCCQLNSCLRMLIGGFGLIWHVRQPKRARISQAEADCAITTSTLKTRSAR